jgi:hypothetical protein
VWRSTGEVGETYSLVYAHGLLSRISLHRNDLHRAREAADAGERCLAGWGRGHSMSWVAWPRALIFEAEGQGGQALSTMASLWDWCADSGLVLELPAIISSRTVQTHLAHVFAKLDISARA